MQPYAVDNAGMAFGIVYDHIMAAAQYVYDAYHTLVAIVQQNSIFFLYKFSELTFQLFMIICIAAHHTCAHRQGQSELCSSFSIGFTYLGMIGKPEIIVQAP